MMGDSLEPHLRFFPPTGRPPRPQYVPSQPELEEFSQFERVVLSVTYRAVEGCTNTSPVGAANLKLSCAASSRRFVFSEGRLENWRLAKNSALGSFERLRIVGVELADPAYRAVRSETDCCPFRSGVLQHHNQRVGERRARAEPRNAA